ncbi:uncharacterized protein K452DRAFT_314144 [Aplosporella prunicola CBS 121167]|uniref:Uncharacterized protein n=1 Tax=Aplosporella prunicola CBS 121167 TaxID=1176127 RepID=A0A6A6AWT2_9PEZI|nr:uncharacterized protein K452DRAFT_314144 [Aplosporella prunicola CBS 121167]KAF2135247.1 hypothetical protein K452DRAFT_314144 [Aplosporella prunicola CBS 121167]
MAVKYNQDETLTELEKHGLNTSCFNVDEFILMHLPAEAWGPYITLLLLDRGCEENQIFHRLPAWHTKEGRSAANMDTSLRTTSVQESMETIRLQSMVIGERETLLIIHLKRLTAEHPLRKDIDRYLPGASSNLICMSVISGTIKIMEVLIRYGAGLETEGCIEGTSLMAACCAGSLSVVKFLICRGAQEVYASQGKLKSALDSVKHLPRFVTGY